MDIKSIYNAYLKEQEKLRKRDKKIIGKIKIII